MNHKIKLAYMLFIFKGKNGTVIRDVIEALYWMELFDLGENAKKEDLENYNFFKSLIRE